METKLLVILIKGGGSHYHKMSERHGRDAINLWYTYLKECNYWFWWNKPPKGHVFSIISDLFFTIRFSEIAGMILMNDDHLGEEEDEEN